MKFLRDDFRKYAESVHIRISMSQKTFSEVKALKKLGRLKSEAEVFSNAVQLYAWMLNKQTSGTKFFMSEKDGELKPIEMSFDRTSE